MSKRQRVECFRASSDNPITHVKPWVLFSWPLRATDWKSQTPPHSPRLVWTMLKLVRPILNRLWSAVLFQNVGALQKKHEGIRVGGEQYRDKKRWNVDSGTEETHVGNLSGAFI